MIAPTSPSCSIRRTEQRLEFDLVEESDKVLLESLMGNGQDTFDDGGVFGVAKCSVAKQGADCSKPCCEYAPRFPAGAQGGRENRQSVAH